MILIRLELSHKLPKQTTDFQQRQFYYETFNLLTQIVRINANYIYDVFDNKL